MIQSYQEQLDFIARAEGMGFALPARARKIVACVESLSGPQDAADRASKEITAAFASADQAAFTKSLDTLLDATARVFGAERVRPFVGGQTFGVLHETIVPAMWEWARSQFNAAGTALSESIAYIDADAEITIDLKLTEAERAAYKRSPVLAGELDSFARLLADIKMQLTSGHTFRFQAKAAEEWVGLCVRMNGAHPRRVLEVWQTSPNFNAFGVNPQPDPRRGKRWAEIIKLGAILEAPETVDAFWPLELPEVLLTTEMRGVTKVPGVTVDPLDGEESVARAARIIEHRRSHGLPTGEFQVSAGTPAQRPDHLPAWRE